MATQPRNQNELVASFVAQQQSSQGSVIATIATRERRQLSPHGALATTVMLQTLAASQLALMERNRGDSLVITQVTDLTLREQHTAAFTGLCQHIVEYTRRNR